MQEVTWINQLPALAVQDSVSYSNDSYLGLSDEPRQRLPLPVLRARYAQANDNRQAGTQYNQPLVSVIQSCLHVAAASCGFNLLLE